MEREPDRLIGESPAFLQCLEEVSQIARLNKPVLVVGERGTGKELIASRLHYLSNRWDREFVKMNCAAINDSLLETELFGHDAGAFTGATRAHKGRFERADSGTLFLDELATTSLLVQEKILRVIEYGEFERVGGSSTLRTDVRLIAATNEDLPRLADEGRFRQDLLDRLAFDVITLPPLRARSEDVMLLSEHFAINMATELGQELFPGFTQAATDELRNHLWPGNIRELKNVIERCVYRSDPDEPIQEIVFDPFDSPFRPAPSNLDRPSTSDREHARAESPSATPDITLPVDLKEQTQRFEIELINKAMSQARHNQKSAAELLGVTYHQLRGYLKKYELLKTDPAESEAS